MCPWGLAEGPGSLQPGIPSHTGVLEVAARPWYQPGAWLDPACLPAHGGTPWKRAWSCVAPSLCKG